MEYPGWDSDIPLAIFFGVEPSVTDIVEGLITDICCSIPSMNIQTLHVFDPPFSHDFRRKMVGHLHGLRFMGLSEGYMPDLASLLTLVADEPVRSRSGGSRNPTARHIFVPTLEELDLYGITFAAEDGVSEESLLNALATREVRPRLIMAACGGVGDVE